MMMAIDRFRPRILPFDEAATRSAASLFALPRNGGLPLHQMPIKLADLQIAGIAAANECSLATRTVGDFRDLGIDLIDPWSAFRQFLDTDLVSIDLAVHALLSVLEVSGVCGVSDREPCSPLQLDTPLVERPSNSRLSRLFGQWFFTLQRRSRPAGIQPDGMRSRRERYAPALWKSDQR
jgi:hypothetical protein